MIHYTSQPATIGKHQWRIIVFTHRHWGRTADYQWRRIGEERWRNAEAWPRYNPNDGTTGGMPISIKTKVHDPNLRQIKAALAGADPDADPATHGLADLPLFQTAMDV